MSTQEAIVPIAMPGTHQKFLGYFKTQEQTNGQKVLDLGAGHGAFTKRLYDMGFDVHACDLFPEIFHFKEIECKKVDVTGTFPYEDNTFDMVISIEVSEHILDHENYFREANRVLKPGGSFYVSTPNILSMKSRLRFMGSGFFYGFGPLELTNYDGLQHIASRTLDQYNYIGIKHNFEEVEMDIDREQKTSRWLLILFSPIIFLYQLFKKTKPIHNRRKLLLGRLLFMKFRKKSS